MVKVRKIGVLCFARFQGILAGMLGLLAGVIYAIGGLIIDALVTLGWASGVYWETPGLSYGTVLAMGALVGMPIIFATVGFFAGLFEIILYNLYTKWFGAIQLDIEE
jgi:hypothetical protein